VDLWTVGLALAAGCSVRAGGQAGIRQVRICNKARPQQISRRKCGARMRLQGPGSLSLVAGSNPL
jgi:hypothetical protein